MTNLRLFLLTLTVSSLSLARADTVGLPAAEAARPATAERTPFPAGRMQSVVVAALDTDRNGTLSATELALAPTALRALDLNADGALSSDELRRFESSRHFRTGRTSSGFNVALVLDANSDGEIQGMEIANATLSLKALDANGDGQITGNELRPVALYALTVAGR